ncbi:CotH kinase family protein [Microgenomates group bacterium]|nr:CotH kinase family protein [Microgenomates group bacterium]
MRKAIIIFLSLTLAIILSVEFFHLPRKEPLRVVGLETKVFHDRPFTLTLKTNKALARIYYTLDGSEPTPENATLYQKPITINLPEEEEFAEGRVIRARAYSWNNQELSDIWTKTFFIGELINHRFNVPIVALTTDPANLYDYDLGIFIKEGRLRDEYLKANSGIFALEELSEDTYNKLPANYNLRGRESERPVYVEVISDHQRLFEQAAGMRVHGFGSRSYDQKSLRLYARREYDPLHGKFKYPFFPDLITKDSHMTPITEFDKLILRSGKNELDLSFIRDAVGASVYDILNFDVHAHTRPVATYLNGDYYGLSWLQTRIDADYLQTLYQTTTDHFELLEIAENSNVLGITTGPKVRDVLETIATEFENVQIAKLNELLELDWREPTNLKQVLSIIDLDNVIDYYSIEMALANMDWPHNNLRLWRYAGPEEDGKPITDGRWRFIAFDFDLSLMPNIDYTEYLEKLIGKKVGAKNTKSDLLTKLLTLPEYQEKWLLRLSDLFATTLNEDTFRQIIEARSAQIGSEARHGQRLQEQSHIFNEPLIHQNQLEMVDTMLERKEYFNQFTIGYFNLSAETTTINIAGATGAVLQLNTISLTPEDEQLTVQYYAESAIPLKVERLAFGYYFVGWQINDQLITETEITLDQNMADSNGKIDITALVIREDDSHWDLRLSKLKNQDQDDYLEIFNPRMSESISLENYCLTNTPNTKCRSHFPKYLELAPQERLTLYSRGNKTDESWQNYFFNFNLSNGETVRLLKLDENGKYRVIDEVIVPRMLAGTSFVWNESLGLWHIAKD